MATRMMACLAVAALAGAVSCTDAPLAPQTGPALTVAPATDSVLLTYICGNMFRIRNMSFEPRDVRWDIYNAVPADTGSLRLRGRDVGATHVDYYVTARTRGTMRVFVGGVLRQTKANGNKAACAAPVDATPLPTTRLRHPIDVFAEPLYEDTADSTVSARTLLNVTLLNTASIQTVRRFQQRFSAQLVTVSRSYLQFRVPDPGASKARVDAFLEQVRGDSAIAEAAYVVVLGPSRTDGAVYPTDGDGLSRSDYLNGNSNTWAARSMRLPQAWACENGLSGGELVRVAILEQNVAVTPADLAPSLNVPVRRFSFAYDTAKYPANKAKTDSLRAHGVAVAGFLGAAGANGVGVAGVTWRIDMRLFSLETVSLFGVGPEAFARGVASALVEQKPRVLNLSSDFGPYSDVAKYAFAVRTASDAVRDLQDSLPNLLIVKSAGNDKYNGDAEGMPVKSRAALLSAITSLKAAPVQGTERLILVGATDRSGRRASFSNHFRGLIDLYAPGEDVVGLDSTGKTYRVSGTSFAAPHIAGVAAQLLAMDPTITASEVKALLLAGARDSVEGPDGVNVPPRPVTGISDVVYEADAYGSLRLLSARNGTPLCGAHLVPWIDPGQASQQLYYTGTRAIRYGGQLAETFPEFTASSQSIAPVAG